MNHRPARPDLSAPRPWLAQPSDPARPLGDWQVVAPGRYGDTPMVVATYLSEEDARLIAAAPRLQELLRQVGRSALEPALNRALNDEGAQAVRAVLPHARGRP